MWVQTGFLCFVCSVFLFCFFYLEKFVSVEMKCYCSWPALIVVFVVPFQFLLWVNIFFFFLHSTVCPHQVNRTQCAVGVSTWNVENNVLVTSTRALVFPSPFVSWQPTCHWHVQQFATGLFMVVKSFFPHPSKVKQAWSHLLGVEDLFLLVSWFFFYTEQHQWEGNLCAWLFVYD